MCSLTENIDVEHGNQSIPHSTVFKTTELHEQSEADILT